MKLWLPGIVLGPFIGIALLTYASPWVVEKSIALFCVAGSLYMLFYKGDGKRDKALCGVKHKKIKAVFLSLCVGVYFGFSGAGVGTLTGVILYGVFGLTIYQTIGTRKLIHIPMHIIACVLYYAAGLIHWPILLTMFTADVFAGWFRSHIALKLPEKTLKPLFFIVVLCVTSWSLFS